MTIDLVRKFLLEYLPADAQNPVNDVFNSLKGNPIEILTNGLVFNQMKYFKEAGKPLAIAATNGFLTGFALGYAMTKYPEIQKMLEVYISTAEKDRGENVINFLAKKGT